MVNVHLESTAATSSVPRKPPGEGSYKELYIIDTVDATDVRMGRYSTCIPNVSEELHLMTLEVNSLSCKYKVKKRRTKQYLSKV